MTAQTSLYDQDYYLWSQKMANLLRSQQWDQLDIDNIAEEIESLGKSDRRSLKSNLIVLIMHLLKWQYQPEKRTNSWKVTIREHRQRVKDLLQDSPSLKSFMEENLETIYRLSCDQAVDETGLATSHFPQTCPYTPDQVLDEGFLPNGT
ncbi:DUF29 domain-containing protein [Thermostichus vulcanus]|uniref:DUF29 domain-containing protein n=1 Tax=Thermostichus vulcanus str. 'Rupite' TaxID=2813851 RepID=A0ABT0CBE0_THEVL|nr:DUF29 domain-containing protein [Thermostichus vulcanus]MCJ2543090.1 DUF29 domain-containing protein [Thermostichus vulcanus str. 'Rupite']